MTLLQFLNQIRKDGGDISKLKISIRNSESQIWRKGLKVNSLRGNRLSVDHGGNYELTPSHSCLRSLVETISLVAPSKKSLSNSDTNQASILVVVKSA